MEQKTPFELKNKRNGKDRFWCRLKEVGDCWEWQGSKNTDGYGQVNIDGTVVLTHRLVMGLPDGYVCHHCDNPSCCNPEHLYIGTQKDNMRDRDNQNRGRWNKGERHHRSVLTDIQAKHIKSRLSEGLSCRAIMREVGCTIHVVKDISRGRTWRHI